MVSYRCGVKCFKLCSTGCCVAVVCRSFWQVGSGCKCNEYIALPLKHLGDSTQTSQKTVDTGCSSYTAQRFKYLQVKRCKVSIICINHQNDWFAIRHRFKVGIFMPYWIQEMEVAEHVSPDCTFHLIQDLLNLGTTSNSLNMKLDIFTGQAEEIRCDVLDVFVSETNCEVHFF